MANQATNPWTAEEDAKLTRLWNEGVPCREIARILGTRAYGSISGRARRINLPMRTSGKRVTRIRTKTIPMDEGMHFDAMMKEGSQALLEVIKGVRQSPHVFIWTKHAGGPMSKDIAGYRAPNPDVEHLRVDRDPCPRCGAKKGYCNHKATGRLVTA